MFWLYDEGTRVNVILEDGIFDAIVEDRIGPLVVVTVQEEPHRGSLMIVDIDDVEIV